MGRREMDLYEKFKKMTQEPNAIYKELQVQPKKIGADELGQTIIKHDET